MPSVEDWPASFRWDVHHARIACEWIYQPSLQSLKKAHERHEARTDFMYETLTLSSVVPNSELIPHALIVARRYFSQTNTQASDSQTNTQASDSQTNTQASDHENVLFVVFRGTSNTTDLLTDLQGWPELKATGSCHSGFAKQASQFSIHLILDLLSGKSTNLKIDRVVITGHSLGAAVASLVFLRILFSPSSRDFGQKLSMIGFATPLFCDKQFAQWVQQHYKDTIINSNGQTIPMSHFIQLNDQVPRNLVLFSKRIIDRAGEQGKKVIEAIGGLLSLALGALGPQGVVASVAVNAVLSQAGVFSRLLIQLRDALHEFHAFGDYYVLEEVNNIMQSNYYNGSTPTFQTLLQTVNAPDDYAQLMQLYNYHRMSNYSELLATIVPVTIEVMSSERSTHDDLSKGQGFFGTRWIPKFQACQCIPNHPTLKVILTGERLDMMYIPLSANTDVFAITSSDGCGTAVQTTPFKSSTSIPLPPGQSSVSLVSQQQSVVPDLSRNKTVRFTLHTLYTYETLSPNIDTPDNENTVDSSKLSIDLTIDQKTVLSRLGKLDAAFICRVLTLPAMTSDFAQTGRLRTLDDQTRNEILDLLRAFLESLQVIRTYIHVNEEIENKSLKAKFEASTSDNYINRKKILDILTLLDNRLFKHGNKQNPFTINEAIQNFDLTEALSNDSEWRQNVKLLHQLSMAISSAMSGTPRLNYRVPLQAAGLSLLGGVGLAGGAAAVFFGGPVILPMGLIVSFLAFSSFGVGVHALDRNASNVPIELNFIRQSKDWLQISKNLGFFLQSVNPKIWTPETISKELPNEVEVFSHYTLEKILRNELFPNGSWNINQVKNVEQWNQFFSQKLYHMGLRAHSMDKLCALARAHLIILQLREVMSRYFVVGVLGNANTGKSSLIQAIQNHMRRHLNELKTKLEGQLTGESTQQAREKLREQLKNINNTLDEIKPVGNIGLDEHTGQSSFLLPSELLSKYNGGYDATKIILCELGGVASLNTNSNTNELLLNAYRWALAVSDALIVVVNGSEDDIKLPEYFYTMETPIASNVNIHLVINKCDNLQSYDNFRLATSFLVQSKASQAFSNLTSRLQGICGSLIDERTTSIKIMQNLSDRFQTDPKKLYEKGTILGPTETVETILKWMSNLIVPDNNGCRP